MFPACVLNFPFLLQVYGTPLFWILFALMQIMCTLFLSAQLYYMGRWKLGESQRAARTSPQRPEVSSHQIPLSFFNKVLISRFYQVLSACCRAAVRLSWLYQAG